MKTGIQRDRKIRDDVNRKNKLKKKKREEKKRKKGFLYVLKA